MRAAAVGRDGTVSRRHACPTPHEDADVSALVELARAALADGMRAAIVAVPGRVDYARGRLEYAPHLPAQWREMLRADYLADRIGLPVELANDADAGAVGEAFFGAGRGKNDVAYVTVSTGVGAGVLLGRRLVRGHRSGMELGHVILDPSSTATVETTASGSALGSAAAVAGLPDAATLLEAVRRGDDGASRIWCRGVRILGVALANVAHLFAPQTVVVGGGLGINAGSLLTKPLAELVNGLGPVDLPRPIEIVTAALGDDSVLAGCGAWDRATRAA